MGYGTIKNRVKMILLRYQYDFIRNSNGLDLFSDDSSTNLVNHISAISPSKLIIFGFYRVSQKKVDVRKSAELLNKWSLRGLYMFRLV